MKFFFISQLTLLLLALNGNMIAMQYVVKKCVSNYHAYSAPALDAKKIIEHNPINSPAINNKDHENKQDHYILYNRFNGKEEDKMAYYKQWQH